MMTSRVDRVGVCKTDMLFKRFRTRWYGAASLLSMLTILTAAAMPMTGVAQENQRNGMQKITETIFGETPEGKTAKLYTLTNAAGNEVKMTDYGAIIVGIFVPDRKGERTNVTLSFDSLKGYLQRHPYFGATVGRYGNRIAKGQFTLDGKSYTLAVNNGPNHLHGGIVGFDRQIWATEKLTTDKSVGLRFRLTSPDGQEGYPGTLQVTADYVWDNDNRLTIRLSATTDKPTHVNLTNHAYFNLGGGKAGKITDHQLTLSCSKYLPVDANMIPTGVLADVKGTPMDFLQPHAIGERIGQLSETQGYDHCYVVDGKAGELRPAAKVVDPKSGRAMEVMTTQPGVQLYTGNFLGGDETTNGFKQHEAFCLETQHFPDSPNKPEFPTTLLKPGERSDETTTYRFYTVP